MRNHQSISNPCSDARNASILGALALALVLAVSVTAGNASAQSAEMVYTTTHPVDAVVDPTGDLAPDPRVIARRVGLSPVDLSMDPLAQPPRYRERPAGEWKGMRVDLNVRQTCRDSKDCGNALACLDRVCSPCNQDAQCGAREVCVLDHCVRDENASCRSRAECGAVATGSEPGDALCVLSGYSNNVRGNEEMRAFCQVLEGGTAQSREEFERSMRIIDARSVRMPTPVDGSALLADVETHLAQRTPRAESGND